MKEKRTMSKKETIITQIKIVDMGNDVVAWNVTKGGINNFSSIGIAHETCIQVLAEQLEAEVEAMLSEEVETGRYETKILYPNAETRIIIGVAYGY